MGKKSGDFVQREFISNSSDWVLILMIKKRILNHLYMATIFTTKINSILICLILFINVSCEKKGKSEKEILILKKSYENGFFKEGYIKKNVKVGKWIWSDSITNEKLIEVFYTDTIIGCRKNKLSLKRYFDKNKLFLIEKVLNEEQIIGLKIINPNLYTNNILNNNEYHEAGQGLYLFYCSQCHVSTKKVSKCIKNIQDFSQSFNKINTHRDIHLNNEEINQLFLYLKKIKNK